MLQEGASGYFEKLVFHHINRRSNFFKASNSPTLELKDVHIYESSVDMQILHKDVAYDGLGGLIFATDTELTATSCIFENISLLVTDDFRSHLVGGSAFHVQGGYVKLKYCTFTNNSVILKIIGAPPSQNGSLSTNCADKSSSRRSRSTNDDSKFVLYGGAILINEAKNVTFTSVYLTSCGIINSASVSLSYGGGAALLNPIAFYLEISLIGHDSSDIGAGIYLWFMDNLSYQPSIHLIRTMFHFNQCTKFGCGVAIEAESPVKIHLDGCSFAGNSLIEDDRAFDRLFGGVGIAMLVSESVLVETSLLIRRTEFMANTRTSKREVNFIGGLAILTQGVLTVNVTDSSLSSGFESSTSGLVMIRRFRTVSLIGSKIENVKYYGPRVPNALIDIAQDVQFFLSPTWNILVSNCSVSEIHHPKFFSIHNVGTVRFERLQVTLGTTFARVEDLRTLEAQSIRGKMEISECDFSTTGMFSFTESGRVFFINSTITAIAPPAPFSIEDSWLISGSKLTLLSIRDTRMHLQGITAGIRAQFAVVVLYYSSIFDARSSKAGGALFIDQSQSVISNTNFVNCTALVAGGAVYARGNGILRIQFASFVSNHAILGGGAIHANAPISIIDSNFTSNYADEVQGYGGAVYIESTNPTPSGSSDGPEQNSNPNADFLPIIASACDSISTHVNISRCNFALNTAQSGGALFIDQTLSVRIEGPTSFIGNNATNGGGAIGSLKANIILDGVSFESNYASPTAGKASNIPNISLTPEYLTTQRPYTLLNGISVDEMLGLGGAAFFKSSSICIRSSTFSNNAAEVSGGAIYAFLSPSLDLKSTSFKSNTATLGGALGIERSAEGCQIRLTDVEFTLNGAQYGGAVRWTTSCDATVSRTFYDRNWAVISGGAYYIYSTSNVFPDLHEAQFIDNSAGISGGVFFWNSNVASRLVPSLCSSNSSCSMSSDPTKVRYVPLWGPERASSGWLVTPGALQLVSPDSNPNTDRISDVGFIRGYDLSKDTYSTTTTSLSSANSEQNLSVFTNTYRLELSFLDLFNQTPAGFYPVNARYLFNCRQDLPPNPPPSSHSLPSCPHQVDVSSGQNEIFMEFYLPSTALMPVMPYDPSTKPPLSQPSIPMHLQLELKPTFDDPMFFTTRRIELDVNQHICDVGEGLVPLLDGERAACRKCPINTYNTNGDGYCYSCLRNSTYGITCQASHVSYLPGYWATTLPHSNVIFFHNCLLGHCGLGKCESYRTGFLCAECVSGSSESLFSHCSPNLCNKPSKALFVTLGFVALTFVAVIHIGSFLWPGPTLFFLSVAQLSFSLIWPYLNWSIPSLLPNVAAFFCGTRMDPMTRSFIVTFMPLSMLPILWICWLLLTTILSILYRRLAWKKVSFLDWRRTILTSFMILYICALNALYGSLSWLQCKDSILGPFWAPSPGIKCDSEAFQSNRRLFLALSFPLWMLPMGVSLAFLITRDVRKWPNIFGSDFDACSRRKMISEQPTHRFIFHFLNGFRTRSWSYIDLLVLRILLPILMSVMPFHRGSDTTLVTMSIAIVMIASTSAGMRPFLTQTMRFSATLSLAALATLAALQPELGNAVVFPSIAFGLVCTLFVALVVSFSLGAPSTTAPPVDTTWEQFVPS